MQRNRFSNNVVAHGVAYVALVFASLAALGGAVAQAAPGDLDPGFSGDGRQMTDFGGADSGAGVAVQADGRIVTVGRTTSGKQFALARYTANGLLDPSFSGDGRQTTAIGDSGASAVAVQSDGKVVVAGFGRPFLGAQSFALVRYNLDGSLDKSFSGDGKLTTSFGSGGARATALAVRGDGKIVVAGVVNPSEQRRPSTNFALARYTANGLLDRTFSGDGKQTTDFGGSDQAKGIALQPDGKVIVVGQTFPDFGTSDFALARYTANGLLDTSFSGDGKEATEMGAMADATGVALQSNGNVVVIGSIAAGVSSDFALARYNANGLLDTSFSGDGRQTTNIGLYETPTDPGLYQGIDSNDFGLGVALQSDGRIVAVGTVALPSRQGLYSFGVVRYNHDGSLDTSFSQGGTQTTHFGVDGLAYGVAIQGDSKIVVAGFAYNGSDYDFALARYAAF